MEREGGREREVRERERKREREGEREREREREKRKQQQMLYTDLHIRDWRRCPVLGVEPARGSAHRVRYSRCARTLVGARLAGQNPTKSALRALEDRWGEACRVAVNHS